VINKVELNKKKRKMGFFDMFPNILNASKLEFKDLSFGDMNKKEF